jgi:hypothetical protein
MSAWGEVWQILPMPHCSRAIAQCKYQTLGDRAPATFIGVILLVMTEWIDLTVATFWGAVILVFRHFMTLNKVSISKEVLTKLEYYDYNL